MYPLSKSKLMSSLQCAKRLFLEVHQPELAHVSGDLMACLGLTVHGERG